jgi:hypothetical protein
VTKNAFFCLIPAVIVFAFGAGVVAAADDYKLADRAKDYAQDQAKYQLAKQTYDQAQAQVVLERQAAGEDFRSSPDYRASVKAVEDTYRAYNDRRKQVIAGVREKDPRYVELARQAAAVETELNTARAAGANTSIQQFNELYNKKAVFTRQMKAMEDDALTQAGSADMKSQWDEASKRLAELQSKQREAVEHSQRVQGALAAVDDARAKFDEAGVALAGSSSAYADASSLQEQADEYMRRYPPYNYNYGWYGDGGYGYGGYGYGGISYRWPATQTPGQ